MRTGNIGDVALIGSLLLGLAFSPASRAEDTPAPTPAAVEAPAPAQPAPPKFYLELDQGDIQSLSQALVELPKRIADPLIMKLNAQLAPQAQATISQNKDVADKAKKPKK